MKSPRDYALESEQRPVLPPGSDERVSGYGVMGQPFASGHVLGLRRWTASSVGDQFTSIWHRDPDGNWHFYESAQPEFACSRWFGHGVQESTVVDIDVAWETDNVLRITSPQLIDWTLTLDSSPMTRVMSGVGQALPLVAWRSSAMLKAMGAVASSTLGVGKVSMTGLTANGLPFDANPQRIWRVVEARATIHGEDIGVPAPLPEQARLGDFWIPQRGIFAMGRVFVGGASVEPVHEHQRFDDAAATWDDDPAHEERQVAVARAIEAALDLAPRTRAVDVGGGTGRLSILLADRVGSVVVTDPSAGMVQVAQERIADAGLDGRLRAVQADLTTDPLEGSYDVVWSSLALHHVRDLPALLRSLAELLVDGGRLAIADLDEDPDGAFHADKVDFDGHHGFDRHQLAEDLARAGFADVAFADVTTIVKNDREFGVFLCTATKTHEPGTAD